MTGKHRIGRVITRSGDAGETGLADGTRLRKDAPRVEALGELDELNAALGVLRARTGGAHGRLLEAVQQSLFEIGAELALPGVQRLTEAAVLDLEAEAARLNAALPPLQEFVLPGGAETAAWCHLCRAVARRAERRLVSVCEGPGSLSVQYLNRLSDLLFILARTFNREAGADEPQWRPGSR